MTNDKLRDSINHVGLGALEGPCGNHFIFLSHAADGMKYFLVHHTRLDSDGRVLTTDLHAGSVRLNLNMLKYSREDSLVLTNQ